VATTELFVIGMPFFPRADPRLVAYRTPAIDFLAQDRDPFRITTYVGGSEKTLNANAAMLYDLYDIRGYDSIIPKQYADYMGLIQEQSELAYNRIAPIFEGHEKALDSPLLDLLSVRYVLTDRARTIDRPGYTLVYDGEVRIYRNEDALPRAFLVPEAVVVPNSRERATVLRQLDPRQRVVLEEAPTGVVQGGSAGDLGKVVGFEDGANEVLITVEASRPCYLVLADSYFPGWVAFIRPVDAVEPELAEQSLHIYRADGNFRAVEVPAGHWVIRFKYSPPLVKYGFFLSFLSFSVLALGLALKLWEWLGPRMSETSTVHRITKNTLAPILLNVANRIIDMVFAMLMLRILGPADAGQYYLAVVVIGWVDIWINFGLNTLVTREVARERERANAYLANTVALRVGLWFTSLFLLLGFFGFRHLTRPLDVRTIWAIVLFAMGLLPSNISAGLSAVLNAYERMEVPAAIATFTTLLRVTLGALALILGAGYVGLAAVSIVVNLATLGALVYLVNKTLFKPRWTFDRDLAKRMLAEAWPLMINLLMATLFFKMAVLLVEWIIDEPRALGWYSTAYKYVDAVQLVPAYFTLAIFPLISRYAEDAHDSLRRAYFLAIKLLTVFAIPLALIISGLSSVLISILGGSQYLPQAARILSVMIWYVPIGFLNSVTQYVLIALNRQRFLMVAFAIGLTFNIVANVLLLSNWGYIAAAYVAIGSELALFIPFYWGLRRELGPVPWGRLLWRPWLGAVPMLLLFEVLQGPYRALAVSVGLALYTQSLIYWRVFDADERQIIGVLLPERWWKRWVRRLVPSIDRVLSIT